MSTTTRRPGDGYTGLVLAAGALLRLGIFGLTSLPALVERRPELTSPLTSFRSLKEGVYLSSHGVNPYEGGVFYHSPLYLFGLRMVSMSLTPLLWSAGDLLAALLLVRIWRSRDMSKISFAGRDHIVALLYLFNPYALLSCVARSTTVFDNVMVLAAIAGACTGNGLFSMVSLALVTHTVLYPILLFPPLILLLRKNKAANVGTFLAVYGVIAGINTLILGKSWATSTLGVILTASDLTPNVGMWWYFFTEMFDHFRPFFRGVFQLHLLIYVAPLCLRLKDPLKVVLILVGAISTWKSYPTVGDMALWAGLLGCFPEIVQNLKHPLFSLTTHLYTCILLPLLHSLWLLTGAGNANFFYAATMVYGLNSTLAIADVLGSILSYDLKKNLRPYLYTDSKPDIAGDMDDIAIVQLATLG